MTFITKLSSAWRGQSVVISKFSSTVFRGLASTSASRDENSDPWVTATPRICLHDVPTIIKAGGLKPNSPVTLVADLLDENGKQFCSHAHYTSDANGIVDLSVANSTGGSYTGVFSAGLLTTLMPAPHEFPLLRLYRRDVSTPWRVSVRVLEDHVSMESALKSDNLAEVKVERHLMAPGVRRVPVREGALRATLFIPPGPGPFPGVVDMFGSVGGLMEFRAAMLASRGIAALALAYFAFEDLPKTTEKFDLVYFQEAAQYLMAAEGVVPDRCGIVAVSKATDIALSMATWTDEVKAVVSISGSPVAFDSTISFQGEKLLDGVKMDLSFLRLDDEGRLYLKRELVEQLTPDHPQFIPLEKAADDTHFLLVAGSQDAWACDIPIETIQQRMKMHGREDKLECMVYPDAGHMLEPPYGPLIHHSYHRYLPVVSENGEDRVVGVPLLWGGTPEGACKAQEDLWRRMQTFIMRRVRDESPWYQQYIANQNPQ